MYSGSLFKLIFTWHTFSHPIPCLGTEPYRASGHIPSKSGNFHCTAITIYAPYPLDGDDNAPQSA